MCLPHPKNNFILRQRFRAYILFEHGEPKRHSGYLRSKFRMGASISRGSAIKSRVSLLNEKAAETILFKNFVPKVLKCTVCSALQHTSKGQRANSDRQSNRSMPISRKTERRCFKPKRKSEKGRVVLRTFRSNSKLARKNSQIQA